MPQIDFHRVRDRRDELGLRNTKIAGELGIQTPSVENLMCGNTDPSMRVVHRLSRLLDLPVDQIVLGDRTPQGDPSEPPVQPSTSQPGPPRRQQKEQGKTAPKRTTAKAVA